MPNDAKLGLVLGVGLVITVAVLFFRKDAGAIDPHEAAVNAAGAPQARPKPPTRPPASGGQKPVKAKPTSESTSDAVLTGSAATVPTDAESPEPPVPNTLQPIGGAAVKDLQPAPQ